MDLNVFLDSNIFSDINLINRLFFSVGFETQRRRSIKERWGVKVILRKEIWSCFIVILHITIKMRSSMMSMTPITMTLVRDSSAFQRLFFSTCWSRGTSESSIYEKQRICRCNSASTHFHVSWLSDFIFYPKPLYKSLHQSFSIHS